MNQTLKDTCKLLRLGYLVELYDEMDFETKEQFLQEVLMKELKARQEAKMTRAIKKAKFRELKWLKDYEWTGSVHFPKSTTREMICDLKFISQRQNLLCIGSSGTGKNHLATALGVKACSEGYEVRFFRVADLVSELENGFEKGTLQKIKRSIETCDVLILDELGYVPFQKDGSELLFHIIADCYEQKSVIVTSNLEFRQCNKVFGDNKLTAALVDRLVHHAHILAFTGESYRLKNAFSTII
ncbi:IS21-like element helper ATPase IstB [Bacillus cytotoxicus]